MRTNIVIDDALIAEAMDLTGIKTKRRVVDEALRLLVRTSRQSDVLKLRGQINWVGDLNEMRKSRFIHEKSADYSVQETQSQDLPDV